jgi:thymidine kinase
VSATALAQLTAQAEDCDVIGIDEAQFFPDILEWSEEMANNGKVGSLS